MYLKVNTFFPILTKLIEFLGFKKQDYIGLML